MERNEIRYYLQLFRRWIWLVLLCALMAGVAAFFVSRRQPSIYATSSTAMVDYNIVESTPYQALAVALRLSSTNIELLKRPSMREEVIDRLGYRPGNLTISPSVAADTALLVIRVTSSDPEAAAFIANTLPELLGEEQRAQSSRRYSEAKESLQTEIDGAVGEIATLQSQRAEATAAEERARLDTALSIAQLNLDGLQGRLNEVNLQEAQDRNLITVVEPANVPKRPIQPRPVNNALWAALTGGLLALGAAFLVEYFDNTIKVDTDLGTLLETSPLAMVGAVQGDETSTERRMLISKLKSHDPNVEAYRMLRTNLRFAAVDDALKSYMVTSPGPSEGKSTTAANLAIAMAQAGHQTVLVDVDLRRPVQAKTFGVMNSVGLTTAIADRTVPLFELFHATDIDNLTLLGSGQLPPNPSELVGSQRMKEIVRELESLFDVVILDSPPVLMVSDSSLLATHVDGIILVVRESETTVEAAYRAAEQIRSVKARLLGTVLNGVKQRGQGYNYYYYNQYYGGGKGQPRSSGQPVR